MMLKRTSIALALGAGLLATAAALRYAEGLEIISEDAAKRTIQVLIGLMLAAYANVMPKDIGRWRASARAASRSQSALRVGGWSLTLAGLGHAGLWAFAPIAFAEIAAIVVVATATLVTMAYGVWALVSCRRPEHNPSI